MKSLILLAFIVLGSIQQAVAATGGGHLGESDKITATVTFLNPSGWTTTDASGTTYNFGWTDFEPKIYAPAYWGTFPGYIYGQTMHFTVALSNTTSKGNKSFKVKVQAISNTLEVDGGIGPQIGEAQEWIVASLAPGQTQTLAGSVKILGADLSSGLDITRIRILHLNNGAPDAGLIKVETGVWCPPPHDEAPVANN